MKTSLISLIVFPVMLAGCSLLPKTAPLPALHDFGPPTVNTPAPAAGNFAVTVDVSAVAWLDGTAIYYRLAYADVTRLHAYADNEWIAPPAQLLQARLQAALGDQMADTASSVDVYRLTVHLLDFEQVFTGAQAAATRARAVAELQDVSSGVTLARRVFSVSQPTQPDVKGAVQGAARTAGALVADLVHWLQTSVKLNPATASRALRKQTLYKKYARRKPGV